MRMAGARALHPRRELDVAEEAAESNVRVVIEPGITPDRDAPGVLGRDDLPPGGLIERLRDIDAGHFGAEPRQNRLDVQTHLTTAPLTRRSVLVRSRGTYTFRAAFHFPRGEHGCQPT